MYFTVINFTSNLNSNYAELNAIELCSCDSSKWNLSGGSMQMFFFLTVIKYT